MLTVGESMPFMGIGVIEERLSFFLKRSNELRGLVRRDLRVLFAVHNKERGLDLGHIQQDVCLPINGGLLFRRSPHLRLPANGRIAIRTLEERGAIGNPKQTNGRCKCIWKLGHRKVHHGSSVAAPANRDSFGVRESLIDQILSGSSNILNLTTSGIFDIEIAELFAVPAAAAVIRMKHDVAFLSQK